MEDERSLVGLKSRVALLNWLLERECKCDRARCADHFRYLEQLKFEYELRIEEYENGNIKDI